MRIFLLLVGAFAILQSAPKKIYEAPVDAAYIVRVTNSQEVKAPGYYTSVFRVFLVDRARPRRSWEVAAVSEEYSNSYAVKRATSSSVIIERTDPDYGTSLGFLALFFDARSKRMLKQVEFNPLESLPSVSPAEVRRVGLNAGVFARIRDLAAGNPEDLPLPPELQDVYLPQSTYQEFAKARPQRVRDGYDEKTAIIEEMIGPSQVIDGRVWFGKTFYDGEGFTGVGAIASFDIKTKALRFLRISQLVDWSVSALVVKDQVIWAGLERRPEGAEYSGGLLRYDLKTSTTRLYRVEDVITSLQASGESLVIGTNNGIYVLSANRLVRHRVTPTLEGKFVFYTETLKP